MIGYTTVGTNNLEKAGAYYDALFADYGAKRWMDTERIIVWAAGEGGPMFSVCTPNDGNAATVGNGVMIALAAPSREFVDKIYKKALELGGSDEGEPGERMPGFYAGYFRDPEGNKLNVFHMGG